MMKKMKLHSQNLIQENIERIRKLFPGCVTEAKGKDGQLKLAVDFDLLRQELSSSIVEGPRERYHINWPGKRKALLAANTPIAKTLRPYREESVDFDTTQNLFIEGDNLEALKLLQETYLGKVKMIYIDPPYNTGKDFIYKDDFAENADAFLKRSNQKDSEGNRLVANTEVNGRFHSDWLSMMYSRLRLARNVLSDSGVIFISIDDHEQSNLKKLCDEVFGAGNFFATLTRRSMHTVRNSSKDFNLNADYILVYAKSKNWFGNNKEKYIRIIYDKTDNYPLDDNDGKGKYKLDPLVARNYSKPYTFIFKNDVIWKAKNGTYPRYSIQTLKDKEEKGEIVFTGKEPKAKRYLANVQDGKPPDVILDPEYVGFNSEGTTELRELLGEDAVFPQPKNTKLIIFLIKLLRADNNITLDFFSGSSTTAHAVMKLNAEDGGNRKFIMVQLPEACDEKSEAFKSGYKTIAEISKERIRRAGAKILAGACHEGWNKDVGFRVLKVDSSNMKDIYYTSEVAHQKQLEILIDNIKPERASEDLLFQVLLDWGVDLSLPISKKTIHGKTVFFVDKNALVACFDRGVNEELFKQLAKHRPQRAVFRPGSDSVKINVGQIFQLLSPGTTIKSI